jgi:hypothetical protein
MVLAPGLAVALVVVAGMADRALVGQADATRTTAVGRIDEDARLATQAVRASLAQLEQAVTGGRSVPEMRAELAELLSSTRATPSGLPEAVVARLALGPAVPSPATLAPATPCARLAGATRSSARCRRGRRGAWTLPRP